MNGERRTRHVADSDAVRAEAAERLLHAHGNGVHPNHDASTSAWRREDEAHDAAFLSVARAWDAAARLKGDSAYADLLGTPTLRERVVELWRHPTDCRLRFAPGWAFASVLAVLIIAGTWFLIPRGSDYVTEDYVTHYATRVAEIRDLSLVDGSTVTLGARSALDVEITETERTVHLAGEAFFSVSKDAARPFVVLAGGTHIRAVGTEFNVNYGGERVRVSVLEGVVEVMRADGSAGGVTSGDASPSTVRVAAGEQLMAANGAPLLPARPFRGAEPGAWREGRLSYQDAPLSEIVADINRYRTAEIRILSPALARERLTTSFRTSQIEQMLATLPDILPLSVERNADGTVELLSSEGSG